jgi:hypothetical protein
MAKFENVLVQTMGVEEDSARIVPIKFMPIDSNLLPIRIGQLEIINLAHPRRPQRQFDRLVQNLQEPLRMV